MSFKEFFKELNGLSSPDRLRLRISLFITFNSNGLNRAVGRMNRTIKSKGERKEKSATDNQFGKY